MKTIYLSIIVGIAITSMVTFTYVTLTVPHSTGSLGVISAQMNNVTNTSTVIIPKDSEDQSSGKDFEPQLLVVSLGVNNTVRWIDESIAGNAITSDNQDYPLFWNATHSSNNVILHGKSFNFTFTKVGDFGYHGEIHPWLRGWALVLPQSSENLTQTVVLNDTKIPSPCETFSVPCPLGIHSFTAQKFGSDIYMEKITINGVDHYAIIHPSYWCVYPHAIGTECAEPDNVALLKIAQANMINTFIPVDLHAP